MIPKIPESHNLAKWTLMRESKQMVHFHKSFVHETLSPFQSAKTFSGRFYSLSFCYQATTLPVQTLLSDRRVVYTHIFCSFPFFSRPFFFYLRDCWINKGWAALFYFLSFKDPPYIFFPPFWCQVTLVHMIVCVTWRAISFVQLVTDGLWTDLETGSKTIFFSTPPPEWRAQQENTQL